MVTGGSSAVAGAARRGTLPGMTTTRDDRTAPSGDPQRAGTQPADRDRVADDVDWTVLGTHPLSGRYHGRQEFIDATSERLAGVLPGGARLKVRSLYVDGDTTIVELLSTADDHTDGTNRAYQADHADKTGGADRCRWVCRFDGDRMVEARAFLDSRLDDGGGVHQLE